MTVDVDVLIHEHKKSIHTIDGLEFHTVNGLLKQLREAVTSATGADGAGSGAKSKLPFQAAALDLYMLIEQQIAQVWVAAFRRVPGAVHPEALLAEWAAWASDDTIVPNGDTAMYAPDAVAKWIWMIEDYFDPPRLAEIAAPCIVCNTRYVYRVVDGESIRSAALTFRRERDTGETLDARCGACGTTWNPSQFMFLAEQISRVVEDVAV